LVGLEKICLYIWFISLFFCLIVCASVELYWLVACGLGLDASLDCWFEKSLICDSVFTRLVICFSGRADAFVFCGLTPMFGGLMLSKVGKMVVLCVSRVVLCVSRAVFRVSC
jgi:hypothetical protein